MPPQTDCVQRSRNLCHWLAVLAMLCTARATAADPQPSTDARRPPAIKTENVPAVEAELWQRLNQYQNIRTATFSSWSPDGHGMLVSTRFGNSVQLHRVYEPGGRREQWTFFDEPVGGRFVPQAADDAVILSMGRGGDENYQLYLLERQKNRNTLLSDGASRNVLGPVTHDGAQAIVHSNRRNGRDTDLYATNLRSGDTTLLLATDGEYWSASDWSQDGGRLLLNRYVSINESYPAWFDVGRKALQPLPLPGPAPMSFGTLKFLPDGQHAYVTCDARGEFLQLARLNLANGEYEWLTSDLPWDVDQVEVHHDSGKVAFTTNEDGASRLYLLTGDRYRPLELPLGVVTDVQFSPDGKRLGLTLARPDAPADAYSVEIATGQLTRWTYSEVGGLLSEQFVVPTRVQFRSFDDRQIPAYYFRPPQASPDSPASVLINIHGGPEGQYRPIFSGAIQHYAAAMGLAVLCPNVRGSSGYGKTYLKLDNAERREESVRDIGALLDWVAQQRELDPRRVAVTGGSYGGYMVLASLVHFGDRLRAGIDVVGIANFITFLERTSPYRQDLRRAEYGDERKPEMRAVFERINPAANADKIRSALLVVHGVNDPRVPFSEAQQIADRVRAAGRSVWTVYADNEGHGFAKKDNRDYAAAVEAMFLAEHLRP